MAAMLDDDDDDDDGWALEEAIRASRSDDAADDDDDIADDVDDVDDANDEAELSNSNEQPLPLPAEDRLLHLVGLAEILDREVPFSTDSETVEVPTNRPALIQLAADIDAIEVFDTVENMLRNVGDCGITVFGTPKRY